MPDQFTCRCSCVDPILLSVAIGDNHFAMKRYQFNATCLTKPIQFDAVDFQPTWDGVAEFLETPYTFCDNPTTITATMTATGIDIGDVEISIFDDASNLIARYLNDVVWQPNCDTQFVLVEYDPACSCGEWQPYPCLGPLVEPCDLCRCNAGQLVMSAVWTDITVGFPTPTPVSDPLGVIGTPLTHECVSVQEALDDGITAGSCFWKFSATDGVNSAVSYVVYTTSNGQFQFILSLDGGLNGFGLLSTAPGDDWCDAGPWTKTIVANGAGSVTVTPVEVADVNRPEIRFDCNPLPDPANCNGESLWTLKAWTIGDLYMFYWDMDSETCTGTVCNNGKLCNAAPPFDVPTYLIDEGQATALEILDRLNEQIAGSCGCVDPYVPPEEPDYCNGTSSWTLRRTLCPGPGDLYLYYWEPDSNTCEGDCSDSKTCFPQPPYPLSEFPMDDGEAASLGYLDALNESDTGECGCAEDGYSIPECPECDCDDVTADKTFTVGAYTFTLSKGASPCGADPCCWGGSDGANGEASLAFNVGVGTWEMTVAIEDPGSPGNFFTAGYTGGSHPCDDPIVLALTGGDPGFSWPATITVSNV